MRRQLTALGLAGTLVLALVQSTAGSPAAKTYIVTLKTGVALEATVEGLAQRLGFAPTHVYHAVLHGFAAPLTSTQVSALGADNAVRTIVADRPVRAVAQTLPTGVNRIEGDRSSTAAGDGAGSVGIAVAVIDTGIDIDHPDLNVAGGRNCSTGRSYDDGNGHGTHVAGTIGAKDNGIGVVGVAPGAPLYAVRVLNNAGSGSWSSVICGVDWVAANAASKGIKVANMSLGGSGSDGSCSDGGLRQAICEATAAGVTFVVAAGNSSAEFADFVPATYPEVLTVTAMADFNGEPGGGAGPTCREDVDDTYADFSNFAVTTEDQSHTIAGPGVCINSTWKGGGYKSISGTSMASPHVAGTAALCIWSNDCGTGTPSEVITKLLADAENKSTADAGYGFAGSPSTTTSTGRVIYFGYLVYAGGY